jgi:hypothetical protein
VHIDTVEQGTGDSLPVALDGPAFAAAYALIASPPTAWARVRRSDEHEIGGQATRVIRPGQNDAAILQNLPQRFPCSSLEFGQFIEEENASVGE